jgi:predicted amidohydrolase
MISICVKIPATPKAVQDITNMRIALIQLRVEKNMAQNSETTLHFLGQAAEKGAKLICYPEIQLTPFFPQFPKTDASMYALAINHQIVKRLQQKCKELGVVAIPNIYLEENEKLYDASPVIDADGTILGISKMVHIPQQPYFYEQDYYAPSDSGFHVYNTAIGKIGVVICMDRRFPESFRTCVLQGAQLIIVPTANTKAEMLEVFEWEIKIAAMQNIVFIAMCNRVGVEDEMQFAGESIVVDPTGNVIRKADDSAQILYADIDFSSIEEVRKVRPYWQMRRPEFYRMV